MIALVACLGGVAHADEPYDRVTASIDVPLLLVPVVALEAEVAIAERWSVGVRGGAGQFEAFGTTSTLAQGGVHGAYHPLGSVRRGLQLGLGARAVSTEGDAMLLGLDDGLAVGAFVGYRRVFGSGVTLAGRLGAEVPLVGEADGRVLPSLSLLVGVSFWSNGESVAAEPTPTPAQRPLDHHRGLLIGWSLGGGAATAENCDACELRPGIAMGAVLGWFLHRRFAIAYDATVTFGLLESFVGAGALGLHAVAAQYWPRDDVSVKVGVGAAQLLDPPSISTGGGGTLAVAYELHHRRNRALAIELRATHGSFHEEDGEAFAMNTFTGAVGWYWY